MSQPENPNETQPEPVLGWSGPSVGADGSDCPEDHLEDDFESMPVIDAVPISMVAPEDVLAEPTPKVSKRRSIEEMAKRPEWLPDDWTIDLRVRSSGASTGLIDRYFFDPSGRKFRSKHEVLHFLKTGNKLKRNADNVPSGSKKSKKSSSTKNEESKAVGVDAPDPLDTLRNIQTNPPQRT